MTRNQFFAALAAPFVGMFALKAKAKTTAGKWMPYPTEYKAMEVWTVSGWIPYEFEQISPGHVFRQVGDVRQYLCKSIPVPCDPPGNFAFKAELLPWGASYPYHGPTAPWTHGKYGPSSS